MTIPFHCPWVPSFVRVVTQSVKQTTCHLRHKETMFCHIFPLHVLVSHFCQTCQTVEFIISFFHLFFPRSKAEKVFRPWWDTLEDYLLNSLVLLGEFSLCLCLCLCSSWWVFSLYWWWGDSGQSLSKRNATCNQQLKCWFSVGFCFAVSYFPFQ